MAIDRVVAWRQTHGLAAVMAVLVATFCLAGAAHSAPATAGCAEHESSVKLCAQSGHAPLPGILMQVAAVRLAWSPTAWLPLPPPPRAALQVHAAPSAPRAPPRLLA